MQRKRPVKIAITGATGALGRLVIDELLARGAVAEDLVALGRNPEKLAELAALGVQTRTADYNAPASLTTALEGVDKLLLISSSEVGSRTGQHENVINAAKQMNVSLVAYTSMAGAMASGMLLAQEHAATEQLLAASGLDYVLLRNGWYVENYLDQLMGYLNSGVILGCAKDGKVSAAPRADFAAAAAAVLLAAEDQAGRIYELGASRSFTLAQLAGALGAAAGQQVEYRDLDPQLLEDIYRQSGVDGQYAAILVDTDVKISEGALEVAGNDLEQLIGRPTPSLGKLLKAALAE